MDIIVEYAKQHTRAGQDYSTGKPGDRPWNDPAPSRWHTKEVAGPDGLTKSEANLAKPLLRAVIFDFSGVSNGEHYSYMSGAGAKLTGTHSRYNVRPKPDRPAPSSRKVRRSAGCVPLRHHPLPMDQACPARRRLWNRSTKQQASRSRPYRPGRKCTASLYRTPLPASPSRPRNSSERRHV